MIEIYLLEQLNAFATYGTLSEASEQLNITQPSLSRSMQKLEQLLGVSLFERGKNKISLNDTGKLAAEYAKRILEQEEEMELTIQRFDRSLHTLTFGSCAPGPLMELLPRTAAMFSNLTISSKVDTEENLINGLMHSEYGIILLNHPISSEEYCCKEYITEKLYLSVTSFHPASTYSRISFQEMDGQNFIMYAEVGCWADIVQKNMPHSTFFRQESMDAVGELAKYSELPTFATDISIKNLPSRRNNRIYIPFSNPESSVTFYLIFKKSQQNKFQRLLESL